MSYPYNQQPQPAQQHHYHSYQQHPYPVNGGNNSNSDSNSNNNNNNNNNIIANTNTHPVHHAPYPSGGPVQDYQAMPDGNNPPHLPPRSASYSAFGQQQQYQQYPSQQDYRPMTSYNPQEYARSPPLPPSQFQPQRHSPVHRTSSAGHSYNPADYAHTSYSQPAHPSSYASGAHFSPSSSQHSYVSPPLQSPTHHPIPPMSQPYPYPPTLPYSAPPLPPQHSYPPSDYVPPAVPVPHHSYPSISTLPGMPIDDMNFPTPPSHTDLLNDYYPFEQQAVPSAYPVTSLLPSPPAPPPPAHGSPQRSNTLRHPQLRPLPGPPSSEIEPDFAADYFLQRPEHRLRGSYATEEEEAQDELFSQVESAVLHAGAASTARRNSPRVDMNSFDPVNQPQPLFSPRDRRNGRSSNSVLSQSRASVNSIINEYSDEDAEALAGLEAMRMADEQDAADEARRQSSGTIALFSTHSSISLAPRQREPEPDDFSGVGMDMSTLGGGYEANLTYGRKESASLAAAADTNGTSPTSHSPSAHSSQRSADRSHGSSNPSRHGSLYDYNAATARDRWARVDAGGTGGLAEPNRRQSYDEGDEYSLMDEYAQSWEEPPDLFFHPEPSTTSTHRPLPPPPLHSEDSLPHSNSIQRHDSQLTPAQSAYPLAPTGYERSTTDPNVYVPRSASLISREPAPVLQPIRAKTDAEERRTKSIHRNAIHPAFDTIAVSSSSLAVDLPSLPTKRFNLSKLGNADFKKCEEPWAVSAILNWLLMIADPEQAAELKESMVKDALVALFTNKVPTMNIADAEALSNRVVDDMYSAGTMTRTEEWVKLSPGVMGGVIFQLTMAGCYAPTVHNHIIPGRCYSHHCQRTLKKVNLQAVPKHVSEDWATFYSLKKDDVEKAGKKEIELQNNLHEIVHTEEVYMENMDVLIRLYRDPLAAAEPSIIAPKRLNRFLADVFGKVEAVKKANEEYLLAQLKYRQIEQGPWVKGFSDIFRQWIRKAKAAYIEYAASVPGAVLLMNQEIERNLGFRAFVEKARSQKTSNKLGWDNYVKAPVTRLQRYTLLLSTVHKNMKQESEEKTNLQIAIEEIRAVTMDCNNRFAEMEAKVVLQDLNQKLILRPGMQEEVELSLTSHGRELVFRGDLQRTGQTRLSWVDTHALLFDHYLVLAKPLSVVQKESGAKVDRYDVSRLPIPMDLLILEVPSEDAVVKSSYVRGITSVTPRPTKAPPSPDPNRIGRTTTGQTSRPDTLQHVNTGSSMNSLTPVNSASGKMISTTILEGPKDSEKAMYPFRIHHLGKEVYTLFAPTAANRNEWCSNIIEAKTKHAAALYAQNAEPFRLKVIADSAFYHDLYSNGGNSTMGRPVVIKGTPVDRAIKEVEHRFKDSGRPAPICRARVNCATSFTTPYPGKHMVAIGTDYGVYVSEINSPRGWCRAINQTKVMQMAVLEEFNIFLLLADKALIAYHLDTVCPSDKAVNGNSQADSSRKAPQKLSGSRDVGFFAVGRMKERTLVFYKKKDGVSSIFKVLEPVFLKTTEKKRGIFKRGATELFRDYDDFYVGTECTGINLFHSSLAVSTDRGFEVLTLDKKQSWGVPDWKAPEVQNIATHVEKQTTLGMLRLNDQEFLLCYEKCAVYVNKHGEVCRSVVMNFVAKAKSAALYGPFLILFDNDFVEIRNAQNGRLKQIIAGRDIKCLDDGGGGTLSGGGANTGVVNGVPTGLGAASRTVKVVMQHPELERTQIVLELVLNDGMKD